MHLFLLCLWLHILCTLETDCIKYRVGLGGEGEGGVIVHVRSSLVQLKVVNMRWGKPVCAPPGLWSAYLALPLKQFQCWSDLTMAFLRKVVERFFLFLSPPGVDGRVSWASCPQTVSDASQQVKINRHDSNGSRGTLELFDTRHKSRRSQKACLYMTSQPFLIDALSSSVQFKDGI